MRFTLSKSEILRGYQSFTRVITTGNSINTSPVRCYYIRSTGLPPRILAGFSVSRNIKRAVDRNKAKRLMRESYRLNKHPLQREYEASNSSLEIVLMYTGLASAPGRIASLEEVDRAMKKILSRIIKES